MMSCDLTLFRIKINAIGYALREYYETEYKSVRALTMAVRHSGAAFSWHRPSTLRERAPRSHRHYEDRPENTRKAVTITLLQRLRNTGNAKKKDPGPPRCFKRSALGAVTFVEFLGTEGLNSNAKQRP